jgi:hypothetical protein
MVYHTSIYCNLYQQDAQKNAENIEYKISKPHYTISNVECFIIHNHMIDLLGLGPNIFKHTTFYTNNSMGSTEILGTCGLLGQFYITASIYFIVYIMRYN